MYGLWAMGYVCACGISSVGWSMVNKQTEEKKEEEEKPVTSHIYIEIKPGDLI